MSAKIKVVCTGGGTHRETSPLHVFVDRRSGAPLPDTRAEIETQIEFAREITPTDQDVTTDAEAIMRDYEAAEHKPWQYRRRWRTTKAGKRFPGADHSENMRVIEGKRGTVYEFRCCQGPVRIPARRILGAFDAAEKKVDISYVV